MAVAWIVSSGEHFVVELSRTFFFFFFFFFFFYSGKDILGHFKRRFVPQISSQSLKQGRIKRMKAAFGNGRVHDIFLYFFPTSALGKRARKLDPDLMSERRKRTIKENNMEYNSLFVEIVGFMRFV